VERCIPIQKNTTAPAISPHSTIDFSVRFQNRLEPAVIIQLGKILNPYHFDVQYNTFFDARSKGDDIGSTLGI
jgi:hypothetical protein